MEAVEGSQEFQIYTVEDNGKIRGAKVQDHSKVYRLEPRQALSIQALEQLIRGSGNSADNLRFQNTGVAQQVLEFIRTGIDVNTEDGTTGESPRRKDCVNSPRGEGKRNFTNPKDQGWGLLLNSGLVDIGDTIVPPKQNSREGIVLKDGKILERETQESWNDPIAFHVRDNDWKQSGSYNTDRQKIKLCKLARDGRLVTLGKLIKAVRGDKKNEVAMRVMIKKVIGSRIQLKMNLLHEDDTVKELKNYPAKIKMYDDAYYILA